MTPPTSNPGKSRWPAMCGIAALAVLFGWVYRHELRGLASFGVASEELAPAAKLAIGMNLARVADWSAEWSFVDVYKRSRPWALEGKTETNAKGRVRGVLAPTDEFGWPLLKPGETAVSYIFMGLEGHYPGGKYLCTFDGEGELTFALDAKIVQKSPDGRRLIVEVRPRKGIQMRLGKVNPANPVRNIRIWTPEYEKAASAFHPLFVERLRPFSVLRFMDWQATNSSPLVHWSERITPDHAQQTTDRGVAIEHLVDLCNEIDADPWLCLPHLSDDEFVREFARLVLNRLEPDRKVYLEYSNETWNAGSAFQQGAWMKEQAESRGISVAETTADEARRRFQIWLEEWRGHEARVVRVAGGWLNQPAYTAKLLERLEGEFDAVSPSGYFGPHKRESEFNEATTVDDILAVSIQQMEDKTFPALVEHGKLARYWSEKLGRRVALVCYEAGQHITTSGRQLPWVDDGVNAQRAPKMRECYRNLFAGAKERGVELMCAFNYVQTFGNFGSWGHLEYQDAAEDSPKWQALIEYARAKP